MDDPTLSTLTLYDGIDSTDSFCLVLLWHRESMEFMGSMAFLPPIGTVEVGRGEGSDLVWLHHNPEGRSNRRVLPLNSPRISRHQLNITVEDEYLELENVGRCGLRIDGAPTQQGKVKAGQLVELEREAIFLVSRRPRVFPKVSGFKQSFGQRDAFGFIGESPATWDLRHQLTEIQGNPGHVLIRGADTDGCERIARGLGATPFIWRDDPTLPGTGALWIQEGCAWFQERPEQAESMAKLMRTSNNQLVLTMDPTKETLSFEHTALFTLRVDVPDYNQRRPDLLLMAVQELKSLCGEVPGAKECFQNERPLFSPDWVRFLAQREWTAHGAELRSLLIDAVHRSKKGWLHPPKDRAVVPIATSAPAPVELSQMKLSSCEIDLDRREVIKDGEAGRLTPMEVNLLRYLMVRVGQEVSKVDLLVDVWNYKPDIETQAVENTIRRLRRKIEPDPQEPIHLHSVWGVGYRFELE